MSINSINSMSRMRFGGLATGLDTQYMVQELMRVENLKVDKLRQNLQLVEWRQEQYRAITERLTSFRRDFFDPVRPVNYILSPATFNTFVAASSNSAAVTATAQAGAMVGSNTIDSVTTLAEPAQVTGTRDISPSLKGQPIFEQVDMGDGNYADRIDLSSKSFTLTVDGVAKKLTFGDDAVFADNAAVAAALGSLVDAAFGVGRVTVSADDEGVSLHSAASTVRVQGDSETLASLGFTGGQSNRLDLNAALSAEAMSFTINGVDFGFAPGASLRSIMNAVNSSSAGVNMTYSTVSDRLTLTTKNTGAAQTIELANTDGEFFGAGGISGLAEGAVKNGADATFSYNGMAVTRPSNTFTLDGVSYTLLQTSSTPVTVAVTANTDKAMASIRTFVEQYNEIVDMVNGKLAEKRFRDFQPLTAEQRDALSEKEVEQWEEKARSGLLSGDPLLEKVLSDMRRALSDPVTGSGITLADIGITTGGYFERGKLTINEEKLRDALTNRGDEVSRLFNGGGNPPYSPSMSAEDRSARYQSAGLGHRISDILQDNVRTVRDSQGRKGLLLEKAGIKGDISDSQNRMAEEAKRINERIMRAVDALNRREDRYWRQFTALERAISRMNEQSSWLAQQFSSM